jgi:O-antigen ligase
MLSVSRVQIVALLVAFAGLSAFAGLLVTRLDVAWLMAVVLGAIALGLVFVDYRVGVVCLTVMLPWIWSPFVPQTSGFSLINFLVFASMASLFLRRAFGRGQTVWLPHEMLWCYLLPIGLAAMIAWPNLPIGEMNFPARPAAGVLESTYAPKTFLKAIIIKPMFFVLYAFLLANGVRDSKKPERFLLAFGLSAIVPALAIIHEVLGGVDVNSRDRFLSGLGLQVNEYGTLLGLAAGPLLFIWAGTGLRVARFAAGVAFGIVSTALLMTGSRGALIAYLVIVAIWLIQRRKFTDLFFVVTAVAVLAIVVPEAAQHRLMMGLDDLGATTAQNRDDPLTKGRVAVWAALAPEFFKSPLWGNGLSSTGWNSAVSAGRIYLGHPHNLFLTIALDLGVLGGTAILYVFYKFARTMFRLAREPSLPPLIRDYFRGALAAYLGMLLGAVTGGTYTPHPEQTFLWCSLGFSFAYWKLARKRGSPTARKPYGVGVKWAEGLRLGPGERR